MSLRGCHILSKRGQRAGKLEGRGEKGGKKGEKSEKERERGRKRITILESYSMGVVILPFQVFDGPMEKKERERKRKGSNRDLGWEGGGWKRIKLITSFSEGTCRWMMLRRKKI